MTKLLRLNLKEATQLKSTKGTFYCLIHHAEQTTNSKVRKKKKTPLLKGLTDKNKKVSQSSSANPSWNQELLIDLGETNSLRIELMSKHMIFKDSSLGSVVLSVKDLEENVIHDIWLSVEGGTGRLHIEVEKIHSEENGEVTAVDDEAERVFQEALEELEKKEDNGEENVKEIEGDESKLDVEEEVIEESPSLLKREEVEFTVIPVVPKKEEVIEASPSLLKGEVECRVTPALSKKEVEIEAEKFASQNRGRAKQTPEFIIGLPFFGDVLL